MRLGFGFGMNQIGMKKRVRDWNCFCDRLDFGYGSFWILSNNSNLSKNEKIIMKKIMQT